MNSHGFEFLLRRDICMRILYRFELRLIFKRILRTLNLLVYALFFTSLPFNKSVFVDLWISLVHNQISASSLRPQEIALFLFFLLQLDPCYLSDGISIFKTLCMLFQNMGLFHWFLLLLDNSVGNTVAFKFALFHILSRFNKFQFLFVLFVILNVIHVYLLL